MPDKKTPKEQDYSIIIESIRGVNKAVDKLSVKLDGVSSIAMSMSNEIARLDERVTFALESQKGQASDMSDIKKRVGKLETYDASDTRMKDITTKVMLVVLSIMGTGIVMYISQHAIK